VDVKQRLRDRVAETSAALAEVKAEAAIAQKRQKLMVQMAEKKEIAVARFMESWSKKEMARIEKALKPKRRKRS
jgi:hypothetical protein